MSQPPAPQMPAWTRPIRIPTTTELTHAEPPVAIAGETATWQLPFHLSRDVPPTHVLKFQLCGGRNNKGSFLPAQVDDPLAPGTITTRLGNAGQLAMSPDTRDGTFVIAVPPEGLPKGQKLTVVLGDRTNGQTGTRAHPQRLLNKFFVLYSLPPAKSETNIPHWAGEGAWDKSTADCVVAVCTMHILGGPSAQLRAYAPATTAPNTEFTVLVRPEDQHGNLASQRPGNLQVWLDGLPLPARQTPVAESTCLRLALSLPHEGVHRLRVRDKDSALEAVANPTLCRTGAPPVFWGMIHGHTEMSDGTGTLEWYFHQLRHEVGLDFAAPGDHDHLWETPDPFWQTTCRAVKRWHEPHEFVTLLGYEWAKWRKNGDGDRNVYYAGDDRPIYRSDNAHYPTPPDLFNALEANAESALVIPHHTAHGGNFCDWKDHSPKHERLVEIFQVRGSYECPVDDGNPAPESPSELPAFPTGYVRHALALGWRVGFTAGGDDHGGQWGTETPIGRKGAAYKQGLMSVAAASLTRQAIFNAMSQRRVVATTGPRMLLTYTLDGHPMGSELACGENPGLAAARHLAVEFHGTAPVERIDIMRSNRVVHSVPGNDRLDMLVTWQDDAPLDDALLPPARFCDHPFAFYYIRVIQTDGELAWASPIWIDP